MKYHSNATMVREPILTSACLNCELPGTDHIDGKCPFEASQFSASKYEDVPVLVWRLSTENSATTAGIPFSIPYGSTQCGEVTTQRRSTKRQSRTKDRTA